jgi:hypothetical protein
MVTEGSGRPFGRRGAGYRPAFEEAFCAGDRRAEGRLKDHISGTTRIINQKNLPMRQCRVYPRSLFNTNGRWAVPAGPVARRFGVFDVSEARQRDVEYFAKLDEWRQKGGLEALLYYFLNDVDISKVDLLQSAAHFGMDGESDRDVERR